MNRTFDTLKGGGDQEYTPSWLLGERTIYKALQTLNTKGEMIYKIYMFSRKENVIINHTHIQARITSSYRMKILCKDGYIYNLRYNSTKVKVVINNGLE